MALNIEGAYLVRMLDAVVNNLPIYTDVLKYLESHLHNGLDITKVMNPLGRYCILPNPLGADYARITTQNYPRAIYMNTDPTETDECEVRHDVASARTVCALAAQLPHAPRVITRKVQFVDLASANLASCSTIPVASPHK
jgi:hypothetical protein